MGIWMPSVTRKGESSGYYLHIENEKSFLGGGMYCPLPEQLQKIRKEINFFYEDLETLINQKSFHDVYGTLNRDEKTTLKNPPKGYDKEHPAIEFLKLKSFTATQQFDTPMVTQKDFANQVGQKLLALKPLNDFINRALTSEE